jgi:hypothetical protein
VTASTPVPVEVQGMDTVDRPDAPLTASDRCDRCNAQAYVKTAHLHGDLFWCVHHARLHEDEIANFIVVDERSKLAVDEAARLT